MALRLFVPRPFLGADRGRIGGDRDRLSRIAFLDRRLVGPEGQRGAGFPDEILLVLRLEQHRACAIGAANDRGQFAREMPYLARMEPFVVDEAEVERGFGLVKGKEAAFVAGERDERAALEILPEMLRDEEDAGDQRIARCLLADIRNRRLILEHFKFF